MILRRMGNKRKLSGEIISMFPKHSVYIEPFFGAGGLFFNKQKSKYNIVNDIDADVFNLFMVVMNDKEALREAFFQMPIHTDLLNYYKTNEEAERRGLVVNYIGERQNLKNRRSEILITNYQARHTLF